MHKRKLSDLALIFIDFLRAILSVDIFSFKLFSKIFYLKLSFNNQYKLFKFNKIIFLKFYKSMHFRIEFNCQKESAFLCVKKNLSLQNDVIRANQIWMAG